MNIDATPISPYIELNKETGVVRFSGVSTMDDAEGFYSRIIDWFEAYANWPSFKTHVYFEFESLNKASELQLDSIFQVLEEMVEYSALVFVHWGYRESDHHLKSLGDELAYRYEVPFKHMVLQ